MGIISLSRVREREGGVNKEENSVKNKRKKLQWMEKPFDYIASKISENN